MQIANVHTFYNVSLAFLFLPFTSYFATAILRFFPDRLEDKAIRPILRHLDDGLLKTPGLALEMARSEITRMVSTCRYMLVTVITPLTENSLEKDPRFPNLNVLEGLKNCEEKISYICQKVGPYLVKICQQELSDEQAAEAYAFISIGKDLDTIGGIVGRDIVPLVERKLGLHVDFSHEGTEEIKAYHQKVCKQLSRVRGGLN